MNKRFLMLSVFALAIALIASSYFSSFADSVSVNFESGYTIGNVNGQNGWLSTGSFDQAVFTNSLYPSFGTKALRISDAVTSGSFGDQTFAPALVNAAGELDSTDGAFSRGILQKGFEIQFDIASSTPSFQPGMHTSVSPDRGDGSRMSYLRFEDSAIGLNVFFDDVQQPVPCVPTGCANFVETQVGTNLSRAT